MSEVCWGQLKFVRDFSPGLERVKWSFSNFILFGFQILCTLLPADLFLLSLLPISLDTNLLPELSGGFITGLPCSLLGTTPHVLDGWIIFQRSYRRPGTSKVRGQVSGHLKSLTCPCGDETARGGI